MKIVSVLEAKNQLSKLIRAVRTGSDIVIANRGEPVARLTAVSSGTTARSRGTASAIIELARASRFIHRKRSARAIDLAVTAERAAWD